MWFGMVEKKNSPCVQVGVKNNLKMHTFAVKIMPGGCRETRGFVQQQTLGSDFPPTSVSVCCGSLRLSVLC